MIAALLCIVGYRSWRATWPWLAIFLVELAAIAATYLIAPASNDQPLTWWLVTGFKRMLLHIVPLLFIAAAIAVGVSQAPGNVRKRGVLFGAAAIIAGALLTVVAAGPGTVRLGDLIPNGVIGLPVPLAYDHGSVLFPATAAAQASVIYDLQNLGQRLAPNDAVYGRFTSVDAEIGSPCPAPGTEVQVGANDRVLVRNRLGADPAKTIALHAAIPPDARTGSIIVISSAGSSAGPSLRVRAELHRGGAWPLVAGLLLLAGLLALALVFASPMLARMRWPGAGATLVAALVLFVGLVQQVDVLTNQALPLWSEAAHTVVHQLRSHRGSF